MLSHLARVALVTLLFAAPMARAQFAVIDVASLGQLVEQYQLLLQQLQEAEAIYVQAQTAYESTTGARGMERLLSGIERNYLPTDWPALQLAMQGGGPMGGAVGATVSANAVLPPARLGALPPDVSRQIVTQRELLALHQNLTRQALATTSARFASLQQLINAIPTATDQKAILELQARIAAENSMLQNEQSKLQTLSRLVQSEEQANAQQVSERATLGHGQFSTRFQPVP